MAFGAAISRCLAAVYTTRARGPGAETAVGHRLGLIADAVLSRIGAVSIDDRGRRSPLRP
jgi:hypothetical protein